MKKSIQIAMVLAFSLSYAQKNKTKDIFELEMIIYKNAIKYNDATTAISSLHHILAKEGENSTYKDSLAILYYKTNNFASSYLLSKELLEKNPKSLPLSEINAVSLQNLGDVKKAATAYEMLFEQSKNQYHGYQLALIQFGLKRFGEAQNTIDQVLLCEEIKDLTLQFPVDKDNNQDVPLKVAALNLKGLIAYELKDVAGAKKIFSDVVTQMPDFALAKKNYDAVAVELDHK